MGARGKNMHTQLQVHDSDVLPQKFLFGFRACGQAGEYRVRFHAHILRLVRWGIVLYCARLNQSWHKYAIKHTAYIGYKKRKKKPKTLKKNKRIKKKAKTL